jgi:hypothetical protein
VPARQRASDLPLRLHARYVAREAVSLQKCLNEFRVVLVVFKQQNAERPPGRHFRTLPGGGSLMIAQNTPSSLTALMNSWKSTGFTT